MGTTMCTQSDRLRQLKVLVGLEMGKEGYLQAFVHRTLHYLQMNIGG